MSFLVAPFRLLLENRRLLQSTTFVELRKTYAGSILGLIWVFLGPLILLALYGTVYGVVFRVRPVGLGMVEYILYVFSGLVPFLAFATALSLGASSLSRDRQVLLNTVFPSELIPARAVFVASASLPIGLVLVLAADAALGVPTWYSLLVPLVVVFQLLFTCGVIWVLSLLTLLIRDIQHALQYVTITLLIVTPIAYTPDMLPRKLEILMYANPLSYFVASYQYLLIYDRFPPTPILVATPIVSLLAFAAGFHAFRRAKLTFYDYA